VEWLSFYPTTRTLHHPTTLPLRRFLSVALSVGFPRLDVIQHRCPVQLGLSSRDLVRRGLPRDAAPARPSGRPPTLSSRRSACKPSFVSRDLSTSGGGHFSVADVAARLALRALARGAATYPRMFCPIDLAIDRRCRPGPGLSAYLVLLPVGFAMPVESPRPRCALTAPFQPCSYGSLPRI